MDHLSLVPEWVADLNDRAREGRAIDELSARMKAARSGMLN
jgi:hypothetical protein